MKDDIESYVASLKVVELKDELKKRHLSYVGNKQALAQRLKEDMVKEKEEEKESEGEAVKEEGEEEEEKKKSEEAAVEEEEEEEEEEEAEAEVQQAEPEAPVVEEEVISVCASDEVRPS